MRIVIRSSPHCCLGPPPNSKRGSAMHSRTRPIRAVCRRGCRRPRRSAHSWQRRSKRHRSSWCCSRIPAASAKSFSTAVRTRLILIRAGLDIRSANGTATRSSWRRQVCATAGGSTSGAARSPMPRRSPSGSGGPITGISELRVTFEDAATFAKPWHQTLNWELAPAEEVVAYVCENNKAEHLVGK